MVSYDERIDWSARADFRKLATIARWSGLSATEHAGWQTQLVLDLLEMKDITTGEPVPKELLNGIGTTGARLITILRHHPPTDP